MAYNHLDEAGLQLLVQDLANKVSALYQKKLSFDDTPKLDSQNPVKSSGIANALKNINALPSVSAVQAGYMLYVDNKGMWQVVSADSAGIGTKAAVEKNTSDITSLKAQVGALKNLQFSIVDTLPSTGEASTIYMVPNAHGALESYDEYIFYTDKDSKSKWEKIGSTDVDLSGYVKTEDIQSISNETINTYVNTYFPT